MFGFFDKFFDFDKNGRLDPLEKATRDAAILTVLEEAEEQGGSCTCHSNGEYLDTDFEDEDDNDFDSEEDEDEEEEDDGDRYDSYSFDRDQIEELEDELAQA